MPFSFEQLEKRTLTTKIEIVDEISQTKEDFHIVFRDVSIAENKRLRLEAANELEKLSEPVIKLNGEVTKAYEDVGKAREEIIKAREEIVELSGKNGDSPKKIAELEKLIAKQEKSIKESEKDIREKEKKIIETAIPTFQQLYLSKLVEKLPDLQDKGVLIPPTLETFQRLPYNLTLGIDKAISQRIGEPDPK